MNEYAGNDFYCDRIFSGLENVQVEVKTENVLAFRHTRPAWTFHVVVVPKRHVPDLSSLDPALACELLLAIQEVIKKYDLSASAYRIVTNGGSFQDSKHLHFHILSGKKMAAV